MTTSFDDLIAGATLPTTVVPLCMAGELQEQWEELDYQLRQAKLEEERSNSLVGGGQARKLAQELADLEERMKGFERTVKLRGLGSRTYKALVAEHPPREGNMVDELQGLNMATFAPAVIAACAVEPVMTLEQVTQLEELVTDWQWTELFNGCMKVNRSEVSVPKSSLASEILGRSGQRSKQPAPGGSAPAGSQAGSLAG